MNPLEIILLTVIALAALFVVLSWSQGFNFKRGPWPRRLALANIAEGTHPGTVSKKTDAALSTRHLLTKHGSDSAHVAICTDGDKPLGPVADTATAAEALVAVGILGVNPETMLMVAAEAIALDAPVYTEDAGKIQGLPVAAGTYYFVGYAMNAAAADGDLVEVQHCTPIATVIS